MPKAKRQMGNDEAFNAVKSARLFEKYYDAREDAIEVEGIEQLCIDLEVEPADVVMLVIAWKLGCETLCRITRSEWIAGWSQLNCDSIEKMIDLLPELRAYVNDPDSFKSLYLFTFGYAKDANAKSLALELAIGYWQLLFTDKFKYLAEWKTFMQTRYKNAVSRDTWNLFLDFTRSINTPDDFKKHDLLGAWPVVVDNFVEWYLEKH